MSHPFGPKNAWVAAPDIPAADLATALGFSHLEPAEWKAGVDFAYDWKQPSNSGVGVFVTPPLGRWTLCVGTCLFDREKGFAAAISRRLGGREVQYFATHRVTEGHVLERAINGKLTRYFYDCGCDGEHAEEGEPTPGELAAGYKTNPPDDELDELDDSFDYWSANEEFVFAVAGAWSVDPTMIHETFPDAGPGFVGRAAIGPVVAPFTAPPVPPKRQPPLAPTWRDRLRGLWGR